MAIEEGHVTAMCFGVLNQVLDDLQSFVLSLLLLGKPSALHWFLKDDMMHVTLKGAVNASLTVGDIALGENRTVQSELSDLF